jgi:hypothetical protein
MGFIANFSAIPIIPNALKPYCNVLHYAGKRNDVYCGLNQLVTNGNFASGAAGWGLSSGASIDVGAVTLTDRKSVV